MPWRPFDTPGGQLPTGPQALPPPVLQREVTPAGRAVSVIESARRHLLACPRCGGIGLQRNGRANGLQRFRCRACRRTFNALTGTPLARLRHKDKWLDFCATLLDPATTVRGAASHVEVHRNTSFRWRHRMLELAKHDRQVPLRDVVEVDAFYLRESQKGARRLARPPHRRACPARGRARSMDPVCVLVARDRHGRTHDAVAGRGPLTLDQLKQHLKRALHPDVLLVTGSRSPYRQFALSAGVRHRTAGAHSQHANGPELHTENVSGYHSRLRSWLHHFRGVATRYLENYCGWRWAIDAQRIPCPEALLRCAVGAYLSQR